jgi:hypothetical protein
MKQISIFFILALSFFELHAQVSKIVSITEGGLYTSLTSDELNTVTDLTITGTIDARDFVIMRDSMPLLATIDMSATSIVAFNGIGGTESSTSIVAYPADTIPQYAFFNPTSKSSIASLSSIVLPNTALATGNSSFRFCNTIKSVTFPASLLAIGDYSFDSDDGLGIVILPPSLKIIGNNAFSGCRFITTLNIPSTVTTIGSSAFYNMNNVTSLSIPPSVTSIDTYAFQDCEKITSLDLPPSISTIGSGFFYGCTGITSYNIPSNITFVGEEAFAYNPNLNSITIPPSVTSFGLWPFIGCSGLRSITVSSPIPLVLSLYLGFNTGIDTSNCVLHVPYGSGSLYKAAFEWKSFDVVEDNYFALSSQSITVAGAQSSSATMKIVSNTVLTILSDQDWVEVTNPTDSTLVFTASANPGFTRTATISVSANDLTTQTILVTQLCDTVYSQTVTAGNLASMIPNSDRSTITHLTLTGTIDARDFDVIRDSLPNLSFVDLSQTTIAEYSGTQGTLSNTDNVYPANTIPVYAFYGRQNFEIILLPLSITEIDANAFAYSPNITSIVIPTQVSSIASDIFQNFNGSFSVDPSNLNYSIQDSVLFNADKTVLLKCSPFKKGYYSIPASVVTINNNAFSGCDKLTNVQIPNGLYYLEEGAFTNCTGLTSLSIPASVTAFGLNAFEGCKNLSVLDIPINSTLSQLLTYNFLNCSQLNAITIPQSVTAIADGTFTGCSSLNVVNSFRLSPIDLSNTTNAFSGINLSSCTLYVPKGSKTNYDTAAVWKDFGSILEMKGFILSKTVDTIAANTVLTDTLAIKADMPWTVSCNKSWIAATNSGDSVIKVVVSKNTTVPRDAILTISAVGVNCQTIAIHQRSEAILDGLIAYYECNGNSADSSGNAFNGNNYGASAADDRFGNSNTAYDFKGYSSIMLPTQSINNIPVGSVSLWFKTTQTTGAQTIVTKTIVNTIDYFHLSLINQNIYFGVDMTTQPWLVSKEKIQANTWYNVVASWDGNQWKLFLNGKPDTSVVSTSVVPYSMRNVYVGMNDNGTEFFNGTIDDIRIFNRALSQTDIDSLYHKEDWPYTLTVSDTSLLINAADASSASLTITSNTTWTATSDQTWLTVNPDSAIKGTATLTVTATENKGKIRFANLNISAFGLSKTVIVSQKDPNIPPTIAITYPAKGSFVSKDSSVAITVDATDADGTIDSVVFMVNGIRFAVDSIAPYTITCKANPSYSAINALAYDNKGATASAYSYFYSNVAPTVIPIPEQIALRDSTFDNLLCDFYVHDDNTPSYNLNYTIEKNDYLDFTVVNGIIVAKQRDKSWTGSTTIHCNAIDDQGLSTAFTVVYTQPYLLQQPTIDPQGIFYSNRIYVQPLDTVQFYSTLSNTDTVIWDFGKAIQVAGTDVDPLVRFDSVGTYSISMILRNSVGDISITKKKYIIVTALSVSDTIICKADSITISTLGSGFSSYSWNTEPVSISQSIKVRPSKTTTYTVTMKKGLATIIDSVTIAITTQPELGKDTAFCEGGSMVLNPGLFEKYYWNGSTSNADANFIATKSAVVTVRTIDTLGCIAFDSVTIKTLYSKPVVNLGKDTSYCWKSSLTLDAGNKNASFLWNTGAKIQKIAVDTSRQFAVTVTDSFGCSNGDTINVNEIVPIIPHIGVVTQSSTGKNIVAWQPEKNKGIKFYHVWRENSSSIFEIIKTVEYQDSTYFIDNSSNTTVMSYQYALSTVDSACGNESYISPVHSSIHLSCSLQDNAKTVIATWNNYEGIAVSKYTLWRAETGKVLQPLTEVNADSGDYTVFTDTMSLGLHSYYQVSFALDNTISPGSLKSDSGPFSQSLSNMAESQLTVSKVINEESIRISPNPTHDFIFVSIDLYKSFRVIIFDLLGHCMKRESGENGSLKIDCHTFNAGVYIVKVETEGKVLTSRLIVQ